jgi:hypothetical protein
MGVQSLPLAILLYLFRSEIFQDVTPLSLILHFTSYFCLADAPIHVYLFVCLIRTTVTLVGYSTWVKQTYALCFYLNYEEEWGLYG